MTREPEGKGVNRRYRPYSKLISPKLFLDHFRFWRSQIANRVTRITSRGQPMRLKAHTTPEGFQKAALFPRLGPKSTPIRHENEAFRKRSSYRRDLKIIADNNVIISPTQIQNGR